MQTSSLRPAFSFDPDPPRPSALRAGALSAAIGINLLALVGLSLMQQTLPSDPQPLPAAPIRVEIITRAPPKPQPIPQMPVAPPRPVQRETRPLAPQIPAPEVESAWVSETVDATPAPPDAFASANTAQIDPGEHSATAARAGLRYIDAPPPRYPSLARRRGWQGEVMLRVHVGIDGRALSVEVEESSGHALLDRQAREHVLNTWRFEPAQVDGRLVEAWGRVPIVFALR